MATNKPFASNYTISFNTFVLLPEVKDGKLCTRVIEKQNEFVIQASPFTIIKKSCSFFGGSFKQAIHNSKRYIGVFHKPPIIVAHDYGLPCIFFPTLSPQTEQNVWIALHAIEDIRQNGQSCTVYLKNDISIDVDVSYATLARQYTLSSFLHKHFDKQRKQLVQQVPF